MTKAIQEAKFLFDKIKKLYPAFNYPDELDIDIWQEVLEGFSHDEILGALKEYRKTEEYNSAPNPAKFKKFLVKIDDVKPVKKSQTNGETSICIPVAWMDRDIKLGRNRHLKPVYEKATALVLKDKLIEKVGLSSYSMMNDWEKYNTARENGLFNDAALIEACQKKYGKDYNFDNKKMLEDSNVRRGYNIKLLSAHFKTDDAKYNHRNNDNDIFDLGA